MRVIDTREIEKTIEKLAIKANTVIRKDIMVKLKECFRAERKPLARTALAQIIENAEIARKEKLAICQDTGLPVVFVELGQEVRLEGSALNVCINRGIETAYKKSGFRKSIIQDPLREKKNIRYTPAVIYTDIITGTRVKLTVAPKGFGSENVSRIKMFKPTAKKEEIVDFVVETAVFAGPSACPPFVIGVGIGGTLDKAVILSKKALCKDIMKTGSVGVSRLQKLICKKVNNTKLGPMGFGGRCTVLGVNILTGPTHIAGLPVAVSIGCHATRSSSAVI